MKVGFIGIGNMGGPMAANLAKAGHEVTVADADAQRGTRFAAEHGASATTDLPALGRASDVVVTMLPDGRQVREVLLGDSAGPSLASCLRRGAVVVDMSSSEPVGTRELGAALAATGVRLVDAPVSGLAPKARAGTLTIMIGADDEDAVERVRPLLEAMGERLFRCGALGCGHAM
jgi:3-hydroxyisobutyrate dehydrogenase